MTPSPGAERRRHSRIPRVVNIHLHHKPSDREIPARTLDISDGGMLVSVPATAPVAPGQAICVRAGQDVLPRLPIRTDPCQCDDLDARIVRVDRNALLNTGQLQVGVALADRCHFLAG
ncbi:MAG: hypothetical protein GVY16_08530 [Planctomycetes bacterium]|nr:hypothetical protein [Planctomycetota bacterium]